MKMVNADALVEDLNRLAAQTKGKKAEGIREAVAVVIMTQEAEPDRMTAEWIVKKRAHGEVFQSCSHCGEAHDPRYSPRYCPRCGYLMKGGSK